jgi:hypothetical protein
LSEKRDVFDDCQTNTPLFVLGEFDNGREKGLGKEFDTDD